MSRIMKRYGLDYQPRDNADDIMGRLKAAGADEQTLAYVQENIDLRHAPGPLGNMEGCRQAVDRIAAVPREHLASGGANVEEAAKNEEYRQRGAGAGWNSLCRA